MTTDAEKRLRPKYAVRRIISGDPTHVDSVKFGDVMLSTDPGNIDSPFVLMPRKDPAAFAALIYYAQVCEPKLAAEIAEWLSKIAAAEPKFGTQGIRNFTTTRTAALEQI